MRRMSVGGKFSAILWAGVCVSALYGPSASAQEAHASDEASTVDEIVVTGSLLGGRTRVLLNLFRW